MRILSESTRLRASHLYHDVFIMINNSYCDLIGEYICRQARGVVDTGLPCLPRSPSIRERPRCRLQSIQLEGNGFGTTTRISDIEVNRMP